MINFEKSIKGWGQKQTTKFIMFDTMLVLFQYLMDSHVNKDYLKFLKQLRGVNEMSNENTIIFKDYKHVILIRNNMTIKMSRVTEWQL